MKLYILLISLGCLASNVHGQGGYKVVKSFPIQSAGGWDYLAVNSHRLYVSHGTQVNILDESTGDSLGVIPNTTGVHGIAFDPTRGLGFTSNGRLNNVSVFDLKTNAVSTQVATGENPDAILFEPFSKTIITCNGRGKSLSVIDPAVNKVIATVELNGRPEEAASDRQGKLFVNLEDKNEIAEVDCKTFVVLQHWSLSPGEGPTGLAYDPATRRLFAGCEKLLIVMDAANGKIIDKIPIGEGCDGVVFDKRLHQVITSNGEGTLSVIKEESANKFSLLGNYPTQRGARTIALDEAAGLLFLPTAEFDKSNAPNGRPKMIPGSFHVLVVSLPK